MSVNMPEVMILVFYPNNLHRTVTETDEELDDIFT